MCGIAGIVFPESRIVETARLLRMGAVMQHRGPDDSGTYAQPGVGLVHQRLSIIDVQTGHQPMLSDDGQFAVVFNGEIYNFLELRQRLMGRGVQFKTQSDTEVLLKLYLADGEACLDSLNGMFAFAIWDNKNKRLFAARDRIGIKPFYFTFRNGTFLFASEIKALFASELVAPELDPEGVEDYLSFQFCFGSRTLFRDVKKLQPGECLTWADGQISVRTYWSLDQFEPREMSEVEASSKILRLVEDSVRLQLRSDVPVGTYLSGGIDSSAVAIMAGEMLGTPMHSFTGVFEGAQYDESHFARIASKKAGTIHHEVRPVASDVPDVLPSLIYHLDEPAAGPGVIPQYIVAREARKHVKVVLTGHGGDELFGGYARYTVAYLEQCIKGAIFELQEEGKHLVTLGSLIPNMPLLQQYAPMIKEFFSDGMFESMDLRYYRLIDRGRGLRELASPDLMPSRGARLRQEFSDIFNRMGTQSYFNKMTVFDMRTLLPALLHVEDRVSMAVSLESRVPLLDHRLAEFAATIPPLVKFAGGRPKAIFKTALEGTLPNEILHRKDKMGFPFPLNRWLKEDVRDFTFDTLTSQSMRQRGWFDASKVEALLNGQGSFDRGVWGLLNLELWAKAFFDDRQFEKQGGLAR